MTTNRINIFSSGNRRALWGLLVMGVLFGAVVYFSVSRNDEAPQSSVTENIAVTTDSLREFDPNTVDFKTLRAMGVEARVATSLLKYRAAGKVYRIPEDVATCYGMTDSVYFALEPYIRISPEYRITRPDRPASTGRARVSRSEPPRDSSAVSTGLRPAARATATEPEMTYTRKQPRTEPLELNGADSTALRSVYGIGEKSVVAILKYRKRLGGFHSVDQLLEIPQVTDENFQRIEPQIWVDSCKVKKIFINFAPQEELYGHPYLPPPVLEKVLRYREKRGAKSAKRGLQGGFASVDDLVEQKILTRGIAERLAPYLDFGLKE